MSGTASIGSRVKFQAPKAATPSTMKRTNQRWRIEKARIALMIPWLPAAEFRSMLMAGRSLADFRLDDKTVLAGVNVALGNAEQHLDLLRIARAQFHVA